MSTSAEIYFLLLFQIVDRLMYLCYYNYCNVIIIFTTFTKTFLILNLGQDVIKMPPKVAKTGGGSKTQTKTMAKASSSSKSSGSSKTSSSSGVKKSAPPVTSKPKNVDKVDFGKPKPQADAGVYHKPRLIAAATGRDPEPTPSASRPLSQNPAMRREAEKAEYYDRIARRARKELNAEKSAKSGTGAVVAEILEDTAIVAATAAGGPIGGLGVGAATKLHNHSQKEKDEMTMAQKIVYDIMTEPNSGQDRLDEMEFVYQHRKEIDECKEITRKIDAANEEARKHHEGE